MHLPALILVSLSLGLSCASGQAVGGTGFNRPPAGVDEALRERVLEFYKLEQAGRFRQAEGLVCEDSKDRYYDMEKQRWTSVEIVQTSYEEGFTKAKATVALGTTLRTFSGAIPVKAPLTSLWHFEKGVWCRYIPEPSKDGMITPFGIMKPAAGDGAPANPFGANPASMPTTPEQLEAAVKLSRSTASLPSGGGTEKVEIFNGMPGSIELRVICPGVIGLECELSSPEVPAGGKAALTLKFTPHPDKFRPPTADVRVVAEPLGVTKSVRIQFQ